ncbi:DUF4328 domain-containing protein [Amycolatopsis alkalitolerans]|uniref:DUF4328 domain-containing protein n=1 Tax=Amycolatopsis alkalitolerans TaxID=2547244 RepID=A0A5C4M6W3_9PSEU|nr:DUF4328 domain-containing protein [Amycolatopsis alkalitolerans]TNC27374.1 DUF4328 domain-containing protein [Amycolatopsis alkalitolerans]
MRPGQYHFRPRVRWVASPPPGSQPPRRARRAEPYTGPPAYPVPPRWGFPNLTWRAPTLVPGTPSSYPRPVERVRLLSRNAVTVLWFLAGLALAGAVAEFWRYALLVISRNSALSSGVVAMSDALEIIASLLSVVFGLLAIGSVLWWLVVARQAAADESGHEPPRSARQVVIGALVPGFNLVMAGSILAELEHAILRQSPDRRPRPSRLVLAWWAAWVVDAVLMVLVIVWRFRSGIQAQADGVFLSGLLDLSAVVLAVLTAVVVQRLTSLLAPISLDRLRVRRVVAVKGAPAPALRPVRPTTSR